MSRFLVLSLVASCYSLVALIFPRPVLAVGNCRETPDYKTPLASQLFTPENMEDKDCGIYPEDSKLQEDNIDYGTVRCLDRPELVSQLKGDPQFLQDQGNGRATINIKENANLALGSETLTANYQELLPLLMAIQLTSQGDQQIAALCHANGYTDLNQCAEALGLAICNARGKCRLNTLQYPQLARIETPNEQLKNLKKRAAIHLDCTDGSVPTDIPCDNIFDYSSIDGQVSDNSRDIAQFIVDTLPDDNPQAVFNQLNDSDQLRIKSLMESKASEKYWIVIKQIIDLDNNTSYQNFWAKITGTDEITYYIPRYLPSLPHIYDTALETFRRVRPYGVADTIVASKKQALYKPVNHHQSINAQLDEKITQSGITCNNKSTETQLAQFMGAVSPAGPPKETALTWIFNLLNKTKQALDPDIMYVYEIYTLVPYQLQILADIYGNDPQSISRLFYQLRASQALEQKIHIPQPVNAQAPSAQADSKNTTISCQNNDPSHCTCRSGYSPRNGHCELDDPPSLTYSDAAPPQSFIPGGEPTHWGRFFLGQKRSLPLTDKDYFQEKCQYYPALAAKVPLLGSILSSVASTFTALSTSCPAPPNNTSTSTAPTDGNVCAIANAYHIPCCYLKGIQLIESGCDPNTSGANTCGKFSCCNSGCFCGPMQVGAGFYDSLAAGQNLNMCQLEDSVVLASRLMIRQKCQGWYNLCQRGELSGEKCDIANKYQCGTNYNWNPNMLSEPLLAVTEGDLDVLSYYYGTCEPEEDTIKRGWGNQGYCGAVLQYCQTGSIPGLTCN